MEILVNKNILKHPQTWHIRLPHKTIHLQYEIVIKYQCNKTLVSLNAYTNYISQVTKCRKESAFDVNGLHERTAVLKLQHLTSSLCGFDQETIEFDLKHHWHSRNRLHKSPVNFLFSTSKFQKSRLKPLFLNSGWLDRITFHATHLE